MSGARRRHHGTPLPEKQLFHNQCWKHVEREMQATPGRTFEVRCIHAGTLAKLLADVLPSLSPTTAVGDDGQVLVKDVERWLCRHRGPGLLAWNVAMTG